LKQKQTIPAYLLLLLWAVTVCFSFSANHYLQAANQQAIYEAQAKTKGSIVTSAPIVSVTLSEPANPNLLDKSEVFLRQAYTLSTGHPGHSPDYSLSKTVLSFSGTDFVNLLNQVQPNAP